jgi:hypothetical protein
MLYTAVLQRSFRRSHRVSMHPEDGHATPELLELEPAQSTTMCGTKRAVSRVISELSSRMPMPAA